MTDKKKKYANKGIVKSDNLQRYFSEISRHSLLTRDKEKELGIRVQEHDDKEAAYKLVTSNLRLVVKIALEFQRVWMQNLLDLIQEGNVGLMHAVKKFDPYKNVKFSYYASFWIKAYILKFIMDNWGIVKIGTTQGQRKLFFKLNKEKQKLIEEGFNPAPKLLSTRLGVSEKEVISMEKRLNAKDMSIDEPVKHDTKTTKVEILDVNTENIEESYLKKQNTALIQDNLETFKSELNERELDIFQRRIFTDEPETLQSIGDSYNVSRERVRQIEEGIMKKMKTFFKDKFF